MNLHKNYNMLNLLIAELLNVPQNTYSQYETGQIEWTASTSINIADYFDVSVDYLLDRKKIRTALSSENLSQREHFE